MMNGDGCVECGAAEPDWEGGWLEVTWVEPDGEDGGVVTREEGAHCGWGCLAVAAFKRGLEWRG